MKSIKSILTILFACFALAIFAQHSPFGDNYQDDNHRNGSRRFATRVYEPYPMHAFNRDFVGLSNTGFAFIDKEFRNYTKSRHLSSEQIRRLAELLPSDHEKFDYLTFSLAHVADRNSYSTTSSVFFNRDAKDAFYRFLVREGVDAGDRNADSYYASTGRGYYNVSVPPQYDRYGNPYNNNSGYNNYNNNNNYNTNDHYDNDAFSHSYGKEYKRDDRDNDRDRDRNRNNTYDNYNGISRNNSDARGSMNFKEFDILKDRIKRNTFEKGKLEMAKSATRDNTLTTNQIADITRLFDFENTRLDYAKFAYDYAYDRQNYNVVADAMSFTNNRKELQKFIEGRKR